MGSKFKVGDRVRFKTTTPSYGAKYSECGLVVEELWGDGDICVKYDGMGDYNQIVKPADIELVDPVWVPKVGDRVEFSTKKPSYGAAYSSGKLTVVAIHNDADVEVAYDEQQNYTQRIRPSDLKPATLTIEAGRYYTTRDGRKVGPMKVLSESGGTFYEVVGDGRLWSGEGTGGNLAEGEDLIALWPEPTTTTTTTAAPVSAQVDAIADEYGSGGWGEWNEPVEVANDNDRLSITIDTSQTSAALDEIIKKLKKIRRLSAELGIDLAA